MFNLAEYGIFLLAMIGEVMLSVYFQLGAICPLLLASGKKPALPIVLAGAAVLFLLFLILRTLKYGIVDVLRYYQSEEIKNSWLSKLLNNLIRASITLIILFPPLAFGGEYLWSTVVLESLILFVFFIYILKSIRSGVIKYRKNTLNVMFLLFAFILISQILFKTTLIPYQTFLSLKTVLLYFALFFVMVNHVRYREEIDDIIFKIMLAGALISCVGILQVFTNAAKIYWFVQPNFPTFFGPFEYWNQFACYVSMATLLTLGSLCYDTLKGKEVTIDLEPNEILSNIVSNTMRGKVFSKFVFLSVMAAALVLAKSRAGIFCFLIAFTFFSSSVFRYRHSKKIILTLFAGFLIVGIILSFLLLSFSFMGLKVDLGIDEMLKELRSVFTSDEYVFRAKLYTMDGPKILRDYPFFGIGLGTFGNILPLYLSSVPVHGWGRTPGLLQIAVISEHLFNDVLQLLIEVGSIGFIILLVPFSVFIIKLVTKIGKSKGEYEYLIGMGCLSSLLFLGLHSLIDYDMSLSAIAGLFTMLLAISLLVINLGPTKDSLEQEIEIKTEEIITLKSKGKKRAFYAGATLVFIYFAFIVSRPLIVENLVKHPEAPSFNKAIVLDSGNDDLYYKYHKFIIAEYKREHILQDEAFKMAETMIDKAIELNPYRTQYLTAKADLKLLQRNYEEASRIYEKASLMEPNNAFIQMGYAVVIFWQAIHKKYIIEKRDVLLKKGLIYYKLARALSNNRVTLDAIIKDARVKSLLMESLSKEGIDYLQ